MRRRRVCEVCFDKVKRRTMYEGKFRCDVCLVIAKRKVATT